MVLWTSSGRASSMHGFWATVYGRPTSRTESWMPFWRRSAALVVASHKRYIVSSTATQKPTPSFAASILTSLFGPGMQPSQKVRDQTVHGANRSLGVEL